MATFKVNGKAVAVDVDGYTPVLWALRDSLNMTGMQYASGGFGRRAAPRSDCVGDAAQVMQAWLALGRSEPLKLV